MRHTAVKRLGERGPRSERERRLVLVAREYQRARRARRLADARAGAYAAADDGDGQVAALRHEAQREARQARRDMDEARAYMMRLYERGLRPGERTRVDGEGQEE